MEDIRGVRLRKFKLRKIILGVRMHFRHNCSSTEWIPARNTQSRGNELDNVSNWPYLAADY